MLRSLAYSPFALLVLLLFGFGVQTPDFSNLQAAASRPVILTTDAHAYPVVTIVTTTPTIGPTSTPLPCGLAWNVIDSPNAGSSNDLFGVAPVLANDVWAVGDYCIPSPCYSMVQHWDGAGWSIVPNPNPSASNNVLLSVAAVSSRDVWAVGYYHSSSGPSQTLVEHWDGVQWSVEPSPNTGPTMTNVLRHLEVVSANDIWAVGYYSYSYPHTLIEHWDGIQWSIVPSPGPGQRGDELWGVSAVSSNDVWAVGSYAPSGPQRTLVEHWDGVQWSVVPSPNAGSLGTNENTLEGVAAVSANDVWAVGYYTGDVYGLQTLALHWDGAQWNVVPSPSGGTSDAFLYSIDALAADDIWAVGYDLTQTQALTQVLHWDGRQWSIVSSPSPAGYANVLEGVAALSNHDIWTAGYLRNCFSGCSWQTLVEHYADPCAASSPTPTPTATPTSTSVVVGHVTWQGHPAQPNALQQLPITLTLKSGSNEINYPPQTTDTSGFFTVSVAGLASGTYNWRVKDPKYLANSGTVQLQVEGYTLKVGSRQPSTFNLQPSTQVEMGLMRAGDANNDNLVNANDFNIMKVTFGKSVGGPGYDDRADFTGDQRVNIADFNLLKVNFGLIGAPPLNP